MRGDLNPLPTKTPIADVVTAYVEQIRAVKTAKSAQTDIYYLRDAFGPICPALQVTSRKLSPATRKRPPKPAQDRRRRAKVIEAQCFEQITTVDIAAFISGQVQSRGLSPKTANRYLEIRALEVRKIARPARGDRSAVDEDLRQTRDRRGVEHDLRRFLSPAAGEGDI